MLSLECQRSSLYSAVHFFDSMFLSCAMPRSSSPFYYIAQIYSVARLRWSCSRNGISRLFFHASFLLCRMS